MVITGLTDLDELPPTLSVPEAGELLGMSRSAAYRAADHGHIPTIRMGHRLLVPSPRLLTMLGVPLTTNSEDGDTGDGDGDG